MTDVRYAQTQGVILLERMLATTGPIFTVAQAQQQGQSMPLSGAQVRWTLSRLSEGGWIARLKRGVYAVRSPVWATELHPFAIAAALVEPMAISHWSALAHHGLTTQLPLMVQASTPRNVVTPEMRQGQARRPRGRAAWRVLDTEFEFISVDEHRFFGFQQEWVSQWHRVAITDPERTVLDMVASPRLFGTLGTAIETLEAHLSQLDLEKLVAYAVRYHVGAVVKRLGWTLEALGVPDTVTGPLRSYPVRSYYPLDPTGPPVGRPVRQWKVRDNLTRERDHAVR